MLTQWFAIERERDIHIIRFGLFTALSFIVAIAFNWPLATMTPIFVSKMLGGQSQPITIKSSFLLLMVVAIAFIPFVIVSQLTLIVPSVSLAVLCLGYFLIFYLSFEGKMPPILTLFALIAIALLPLTTLVHPDLSITITLSMVATIAVAVGFVWLAYYLLPSHPVSDVNPSNTSEKSKPAAARKHTKNALKALASTLVIFPLAMYFYSTLAVQDVLILAFVAILAQDLDLVSNKKKGAMLVASNVFGGLMAAALFVVMSISPSLVMFFFLVAAVAMRVAYHETSHLPMGKFIAAGFTTTLILLGGVATDGSSNFTESFITRISQITLASVYIVVATIFLRGLFFRFFLKRESV